MTDTTLHAVSASQLGLVTRFQALHHVSRKQLEFRIAEGRLLAIRRGVYRVAGVPDLPGQALLAACLAAGPGAVASHRAAGGLWRLRHVASEPLEITVPWPQWARLPGVRVHETRFLPSSHRTVRASVPVTAPARTVVDLSSVFEPEILGRIVDDAVRRRLLTLGGLAAVVDLLPPSNRRSLAAVKAVLADRGLGFHPGDSDGELSLARLLIEAGLPQPEHQYQVVAGGRVYVLDIAYPDWRVGLEYDGWSTHGTRSAFDHDRARGNALALAGWTILHVTSTMSHRQVVAWVMAARDRATSAVNNRGLGTAG